MVEFSFSPRGRHWLASGILALACLAAYYNSFGVPFVFDDIPSVVDNPSIRHLWPLGPVLSPPKNGAGVTGRPLVNFSLALNYAIDGTNVRGYHAFNLGIHWLNACLLFGIVGRTLLRCIPRLRDGVDAGWLAFAVALLWTVHPLQTETVTCVVQRTESLVALFYLLTLYAFIRATNSPGSSIWPAVSIGACFLGMATKEVMVTAPVLVLLYDRTFVAGTFGNAWRQRGRLYIGLMATWLLLIGLLVQVGGSRAGAAGLGLGVSPWSYALTQCHAIVLYLKLAIWPHPLVVDYGMRLARHVAQVWPQALLLVALLVGTGVAVMRRPGLGFLGAWFFVTLAPSSSVVPLITQTMAEHRMYLPLAALIALVVVCTHVWLQRRTATVFVGLLVVALMILTVQRNFDYRSELALWTDTVQKLPTNPRAHYSLGRLLIQMGRVEEGLAHDREAVRLQPNYAEAINNIGIAMFDAGKLDEAVGYYERALRLKPNLGEAYSNLCNALREAGRYDEAVKHGEEAVRLLPDSADARYNVARALHQSGRPDAALTRYEEALRLRPDLPEIQTGLGDALADLGRVPEARARYEEALRLKPDSFEANNNYGNALAQLGRFSEAAARFEVALRVRPEDAAAHFNFGQVLRSLGRTAEARAHYEEALRLRPNFNEASRGLRDLPALPP